MSVAIKPVILDFVVQPDISKVEGKFGPVLVQVGPKPRTQNPTTLRMTLQDGQYQCAGIYVREDGVSEDMFSEKQIIEIRSYQMLVSNGRPFIYFNDYEPKGIDDQIAHCEKMNSQTFATIRASKGLSLDGKDNGYASAPTAPSPAPVSEAPVPTASTRKTGVVGIESVSPFVDSWKIRARCMQISPIREYQKNDRQGKVFSVTFVDETGEIKATAFNQEVDKFHALLQEGQLYYVSKLKVTSARAAFNTTNNAFELMFQSSSEIEPAAADASVPEVKFDFVPLADLAPRPKDSNVDVLGIITSVGDVVRFTSKSGQPFDKRTINIVDQSNMAVDVTLWNTEAENFTGRVSEPIAIKSARVSEFGGAKQLNVQRISVMVMNPSERAAISLKAWYDAGSKTDFTKLLAIDERSETDKKKMEVLPIRDALENATDGQFFNIKGVVDVVLPRTLYYAACNSGTECMKKAVPTTNHEWRCESCDKEFERPLYRYILSFIVYDRDQSTGMRISAFDDIGKELLQCPADDVADIKENRGDDDPALEAILKRPVGQEYYLRIKAQTDVYQGQENMRYRCVKLMPIFWNKSTQDILAELN